MKTYIFALKLQRDESGQDMIEYALLLGMLALAAFAVVLLVGPGMVTVFQSVVNNLATTS